MSLIKLRKPINNETKAIRQVKKELLEKIKVDFILSHEKYAELVLEALYFGYNFIPIGKDFDYLAPVLFVYDNYNDIITVALDKIDLRGTELEEKLGQIILNSKYCMELERHFMYKYYIEKQTYQSIADCDSYSNNRVVQIIKKGLRKIQEELFFNLINDKERERLNYIEKYKTLSTRVINALNRSGVFKPYLTYNVNMDILKKYLEKDQRILSNIRNLGWTGFCEICYTVGIEPEYNDFYSGKGYTLEAINVFHDMLKEYDEVEKERLNNNA